MRRFFHSWIRLFKVIYETYLGLLILFIEEVERDYRATTLCSSCKFYIFFKQELFIIYTNIVLLIKLLPISHYLPLQVSSSIVFAIFWRHSLFRESLAHCC